LKAYYFCNGTAKSSQVFGEEKRCSGASMNAAKIETLVWEEIERFLRNPGEIIEQLRGVLENQLADTESLEKRVSRLTSDLNGKEDEWESLLRLYRRGQMSEASLDLQMKEVNDEESSLKAEFQRIQSELLKAQNSNESLLSVENILFKLRLNLDAELSWDVKKEIVDALVEGIRVETVETEKGKKPFVKVKYRFEKPDSVAENAQVSTGIHVPADNCWVLKRIHYL